MVYDASLKRPTSFGYLMINDPIVEEIRRYRESHAEKYGNDLHKICEALRQKERKSKIATAHMRS